MTRGIRRLLAATVLASALLAGCSHTSVKANAAGSERGYSSNGEVKVGVPF